MYITSFSACKNSPITTVIALIIFCLIYHLLHENKFKTIGNCSVDLIQGLVDKDLHFEVHKVPTSDGYVLQLFRIRNMKHYNPEKRPIFMQHGLGSTSASFLMNERHVAPAKLFADKG